jgi:hypothetical protein
LIIILLFAIPMPVASSITPLAAVAEPSLLPISSSSHLKSLLEEQVLPSFNL